MIRGHSSEDTDMPIPSGYRLLKCIKTVGNSRINTLFEFARTSPYSFKVVVKLKANPIPSRSHDVIYYANGSIANRTLRMTCWSTAFQFQFGNMKNINMEGSVGYMNGERTITIQGEDPKKIFDDLGNEIAIPNSAMFIGGSSKLYFPSTQTDGYSYSMLQLTNNGVLERDYIPVIRESDNVVGFYDLCGSISPTTGTPLYANDSPNLGYFDYEEL